ncbi:hypothetical protein ONZ43_g2767 [Nemania bipapillata]|uniref:Uncharacterized protein n=1 Tax=Nemania bipapillata TaxID=110536 RepID=A0ACC2IZA5_9PEZI|nr:hypothetical protein ONZ43_g2767 [Nemania bipapillata]
MVHATKKRTKAESTAQPTQNSQIREISRTIKLIENLLKDLGDLEFENESNNLLLSYRDTLRQLYKDPKADIQLPIESAIIFFLKAKYGQALMVRSDIVQDIGATLQRVTAGLESRYKGTPYIAGMPKAICVLFTKHGETYVKLDVLETSVDKYHHNSGLYQQSVNARKSRLNEYKQSCELSVRHGFNALNKKVVYQLETLKTQTNDKNAEHSLVEAVMGVRWQLRNEMIALNSETFKPNGAQKSPRFFCACRFNSGDIHLSGTLQEYLRPKFETESCAEVAAMFASQAKAAAAYNAYAKVLQGDYLGECPIRSG